MAGSVYKAHPKFLKQYFTTLNSNEVWVSDITYIRTHEDQLFLATVLDLFSRKIIALQTGIRQTADLIENALAKAACRSSKKESNLILHSDQGSQYTSYEYINLAKSHNIILSINRRGNSYNKISEM